MGTGQATIRGRDGTSASGKKVSKYSPQYKATSTGTAVTKPSSASNKNASSSAIENAPKSTEGVTTQQPTETGPTIRGREGTSASGKKVSKYSPQYKATSTGTAVAKDSTPVSIPQSKGSSQQSRIFIRNRFYYENGLPADAIQQPKTAVAPAKVAANQEAKIEQARRIADSGIKSFANLIVPGKKYEIEKIPTESEQKRSNILATGIEIGMGGAVDTSSIKKPSISKDDLKTWKVYEESQKLAQKIDAKQEALLSPVPESTAKDFIRGLTNAPELAVSMAGMLPVGIEGAIKDPGSVPHGIVTGAGIVAGSLYKQAKESPAQFAGEMLGMAAIGKLGSAAKNKASVVGKEYLPPEKVIRPEVLSGTQEFPLAPKGTTASQLIKDFETSTYRYPRTEGPGGWHATPQRFASETIAQPGSSSVVGLHLGPDVSPHFLGVSEKGGIPKVKLFGWGEPSRRPAANWVDVQNIRPLPEGIRGKGAAVTNEYLMTQAPKGQGYVTPKFEALIKQRAAEREIVVPPGTELVRTESKYYTKFRGKAVPIDRYQALPNESIGKLRQNAKGAVGRDKRTVSAEELLKESEYLRRGYSEPIFTPGRIIPISTSYSSKRLENSSQPSGFHPIFSGKYTPVPPTEYTSVPSIEYRSITPIPHIPFTSYPDNSYGSRDYSPSNSPSIPLISGNTPASRSKRVLNPDQSLERQNIIRSSEGWGFRQKTHYVQDPLSLLTGRRRR
ncbi:MULTISPECIES: hypothetical protein [Methanosarcina]|jgi:hypothetical protein|uniref:Uncharacterized protein n=1 Tax=Methanosarcina flavescens TaxID=1715806 RepID=A0A660HQY0_9EURY|nr:MULTISPECIES: hypothetical protein [Methanosarcina]AKB19072.1 hypothetical protein MSWHS_2209 [Methanosarcina sp. WWM596]AYK14519.1 hypothetical protein AOB57_004310 [Methanosarcina flavescens]